MNPLHLILSTALLSAILAGQQALAHTVWLEADASAIRQYHVKFGGHAGKLEPLIPSKIKSVEVFDKAGKALDFQRADADDSALLTLPEGAALVAMHYDNGIFSQNAVGESVPKPMNQVPSATRATWAVKYHKTILQWGDHILQPLGQPFEVVPLSGAAPVAGKPFAVQVLVDGKPVEGVQLGRGESGDLAKTDAKGKAVFIPESGFNKLWAGQRSKVAEEGFTELSYEYILGFVAADE